MNNLEVVFGGAFGTILISVVTYFLKYYFDNVHKRIDDIVKNYDYRFLEMNNKIISIENKYRDVLDIVLEKFSKWEDRLSDLIHKASTLSPDEMTKEIDKFKIETRDTVKDLKLRVERVHVDLKKVVESEVSGGKLIESDKILLQKQFESLSKNLEFRMDSLEQRLGPAIKLINGVGIRVKEHEFKISNLVATRGK